jgi:hypothetical protein
MTDVVLSIVMLAAIALIAGAIFLWRRTGEVKQPALMVLLALIAFANVLIWTVPNADGTSPVEQAEQAEQAGAAGAQ